MKAKRSVWKWYNALEMPKHRGRNITSHVGNFLFLRRCRFPIVDRNRSFVAKWQINQKRTSNIVNASQRGSSAQAIWFHLLYEYHVKDPRRHQIAVSKVASLHFRMAPYLLTITVGWLKTQRLCTLTPNNKNDNCPQDKSGAFARNPAYWHQRSWNTPVQNHPRITHYMRTSRNRVTVDVENVREVIKRACNWPRSCTSRPSLVIVIDDRWRRK